MRRHTAALCALAAIVLAATTSAAPALAMPAPGEATLAAHGVEAPADTIPWSQVGAGWVLATWSPATGHRPGPPPPNEPDPDTVSTTLYLVDPLGGRYPITTFPPSTKSAPGLIDWSGDKGRALFRSVGSDTFTEVDLHTGNQRTVQLSGYPRYTLPEGKAFLLTNGAYNQPKSLVRADANGQEQLTYSVPQDFNGVLSTPDGTQLVYGTGTGLALMGNDGTPERTLPVTSRAGCSPLRWWNDDATVTLAAWQLPAGTFVQDLGACGVIYLAKLNADGTTTEVKVPDVTAGTIDVVGVNGDSLRLQARAACGGGISLVDYNPSTDTTTTLLGSPLNGGGVISAVAFTGQR